MSELYNYYDYYNPDINECLVYLRGFNNSE